MIHGLVEIDIMFIEATCRGGREKVLIKEKSLKRPAPTISYGILVFPTYDMLPFEALEEKKDN